MENMKQEALPDLELIDIVQNMSPEERVSEKDRLLSEISDREYLVNMINFVSDQEGVDIQIIR